MRIVRVTGWRRTVCAVAFVLGWIGQARAQGQWDLWYSVADAASHNDMQQVVALLKAGNRDADAIESSTGRTALDFAATFDNIPMAKALLENNAHINAPDRFGNTALYYAVERDAIDFIRFLLANKASVDAANRQGVTPLMTAASEGKAAAVRLLLASGADPRKQDFTGRDTFGWAAGRPAVQQALAAKP
ncbi:MAG TPA: ankyrin repeat domain-containing protein [Stellaceae bacterium]|nr:ankyrin repeat domain-containing protein [Stellaceae bacterium]